MNGNSNSGGKTIGSIAGASASPSPSLLDSTIPPINNESGECVRGLLQMLDLPPKSRKNEQPSIVWEHFTKVEDGDPEDSKSKCNYIENYLVVTLEG